MCVSQSDRCSLRRSVRLQMVFVVFVVVVCSSFVALQPCTINVTCSLHNHTPCTSHTLHEATGKRTRSVVVRRPSRFPCLTTPAPPLSPCSHTQADLLSSVRESADFVVAHARSVKLDEAAVDAFVTAFDPVKFASMVEPLQVSQPLNWVVYRRWACLIGG